VKGKTKVKPMKNNHLIWLALVLVTIIAAAVALHNPKSGTLDEEVMSRLPEKTPDQISTSHLELQEKFNSTLSTINLEKNKSFNESMPDKMVSLKKPIKLTELKREMLIVAFEENTSESDIKSVFENYDLMKEYNLLYNVSGFRDFYISVSADNYSLIKQELDQIENWRYAGITQKENTYFIVIPKYITSDENVIELLKNHNIYLKKFVWARIDYGRNTENWIDEQNATKIKADLESNEKVLMVNFDYLEGNE
jgi:hypothetical protein